MSCENLDILEVYVSGNLGYKQSDFYHAIYWQLYRHVHKNTHAHTDNCLSLSTDVFTYAVHAMRTQTKKNTVHEFLNTKNGAPLKSDTNNFDNFHYYTN